MLKKICEWFVTSNTGAFVMIVLMVSAVVVPLGVAGYHIEKWGTAERTPITFDGGSIELLPARIAGIAYMQSTPDTGVNTYQFYMLEDGDEVYVDVEHNGYYLVWWYFDDRREPLIGWIKKERVILE